MAKRKEHKCNLVGKGCTLCADFEFSELTKSVFEIYENFNKEHFDNMPIVPSELISFVNMVYKAHGQHYNMYQVSDINVGRLNNVNEHVVVLGFSGGLDSVFQAIHLMTLGYFVVLFHLKGVNTYENGQGTKHSRIIADKLSKYGVKYVECEIKKTNDKNNVYKQFWPENPIKNQLILSMMVDFCIANGFCKISLGDDFELSINDAMVGVNLTDSRELTEEYLKCVSHIIKGIEFIKVPSNYNKLNRLKELSNWNLIDDYYSCVLPGRFNATRHNANMNKYAITLPENNCGCSCRKCAMHNLIMYYGGLKPFPDDFIDDCWKVMWKNSYSADYKFFAPDIPLNDRIKNLFTY